MKSDSRRRRHGNVGAPTWATALTAVAAVILAACASAEQPEDAAAADAPEAPQEAEASDAEEPAEATDAPSGTLVIGLTEDVETLHPAYHRHVGTQAVTKLINEVLVETRDGEFVPVLATGWSNPEPTVWELELRQGVTFHNGEPFNAEAVAYTWNRLHDPDLGSPRVGLDNTFDRIEILDDYTVRFHTTEPDPKYLNTFAYQMIIPPGYQEEVGEDVFSSSPVGTGPFRFVEWVPDQQLVLEANPDYWDGSPGVDRLVFRPIPEAGTRIASLEAGEVDIIQDVPVDLVEVLPSPYEARSVSAAQVRYLGMNVDMPPYDEQTIRQGFQYAIDQEAIVDGLLGGVGEALNQIAFEAMDCYDPNYAGYPYDPDRAAELLAPLGDQQLTIEAQPAFGTIAEAVAGQLSEIGLNVAVDMLEAATHTSRVNDGESPLHIAQRGFGRGGGMCDRVFGNIFWSGRSQPLQGFYDPALDDLFEETMTMSQEDAYPLYREMMEIAMDASVWVPIYTPRAVWGTHEGVLNWEPDAQGSLFLFETRLAD